MSLANEVGEIAIGQYMQVGSEIIVLYIELMYMLLFSSLFGFPEGSRFANGEFGSQPEIEA